MLRWKYFSVEIALVAILAVAVAYFGYLGYGLLAPAKEPYSGERAVFYVAEQLQFGPRVSGTEPNLRAGEWLTDELTGMGWDVIIQSHQISETVTIKNIIAHRDAAPSVTPIVLLSTHYDTRIVSDLDADEVERSEATPGANAGGSGTATLLELARTLDVEATGHRVCLVFLDAEDNGGVPGWEYAMGSRVFLENLQRDTPQCAAPRAAVHIDLIGGMGANIAAIAPNTRPLVDALRVSAHRIGYKEAFRGPHKRDEVDTLTRYEEAGIPSAMLADLGYRFRYTSSDTLNKISATTLQQVGDVLKAWLEEGARY